MKLATFVLSASLIVCVAAGTAAAEDFASPRLMQPASIQQTGFAYDSYYYAPQNGTSTSPSDQPPQAKPQEAPAEAKANEEEKAKEEEPKEEEEKGFKLFQSPFLEKHRIDVRGWIDQGFTWNPANPVDRFNTPVAYNDRANEYQMNQLYLIAERVTKTDGCGWDVGGRVDMLYGTDRRFPVALGLDDRWNESERFYGLVMPQLYADIAYNNLIFRTGHILAPCGFESVMAPENFFYSHTYEFLYGQPTTLTGSELIYKLNDRLTLNGGLDTGWNNFEAATDRLSYYGGVNWTSKDGKSTMAVEVFTGDQLAASPQANLNHCCIVLTHKASEKWRFALEQNFAEATDTVVGTAHWWGTAGYAFYDINKCWSLGTRYEYFTDNDGLVVPFALGVRSTYNALTSGLNYKPNPNVIVRSEVRGDWADVPAGVTARPFNDQTSSQQFLWGTDLIVKF